MLLVTAPADAAPTWLAPVELSAGGGHDGSPQVAVDAQGNAVAVWQRFDGTNYSVGGAVRPAGGVWQAPVDLSAPGAQAFGPQVAIDSSGTAIAIWWRSDGTGAIVQSAVRPAGRVWQAPVNLSSAGQDVYAPQVAVDPNGTAVAVWERYNATNWMVQGAVRRAGGDWQAPADLSAAGADAHFPQVAVDPRGDAVAVWARFNGNATNVVQSAVRPAAGNWQTPVNVSAAGEDAGSPQVALDPNGNAVAAWDGGDGDVFMVRGAVRPAGGAWQRPDDLSPAGQYAASPQVALDSLGNAVAVWHGSDATGSFVQGVMRRVGGGWRAPVRLSAVGVDTYGPAEVAIDPLGNAVAAWHGSGTTGPFVQAAVRPVGEDWRAPIDLSGATPGAESPQVAVDAQGNAIAVWDRCDATHCVVQGAGYDAAGPLVRELSVPASGLTGQRLSFTLSPLDVWSAQGPTAWTFGDGAAATGTAVTHTYTDPGTFTVRVRSVDALHNSTSETRTITIAPSPAPPPLSPPPPPALLAAIRGLHLSPSTFRAARSGHRVKPSDDRTSTRVSYTLDVAATVRFTVERASHNRTRFVRLRGSFTRTRTAGTDHFTLTARIAGHMLKTGHYRLVATPTTNGRSSAPAKVPFNIVRSRA